jgi:hypothetical protein
LAVAAPDIASFTLTPAPALWLLGLAGLLACWRASPHARSYSTSPASKDVAMRPTSRRIRTLAAYIATPLSVLTNLPSASSSELKKTSIGP